MDLLWSDPTQGKALAAKVLEAAERFQDKHGHPPVHIHIHPDAFEENISVLGVALTPCTGVLHGIIALHD